MSVGGHRERFRVHSYELDRQQRLSVPALFNYLQEAADVHSGLLGASVDQLATQQLGWVVHRIRLGLERELPGIRENIQVDTWPSATQRIYAYRDFEISDQAGLRIGGAISAWVVVDLAARKLGRLPEAASRMLIPDRPRALPEPEAHRTDGVSFADPSLHKLEELSFEVARSDLDRNAHLNHVRIIEWALATVPEVLEQSQRLSELEVVFRAEARFGDRIEALSREIEGGKLGHQLRRASDGQELARLVTRWVPRLDGLPVRVVPY